eukprot:TRINITY_DN45612_c0_g1_i1.p1 TRINITY_DN45612_c0_g1~~TRINITY_DN45612_c0_g1_i1.p1  ORF type:complete len:244 (+),score=41.94 TRINITY_DN45612_c0_g1_i1:75-806(+)
MLPSPSPNLKESQRSMSDFTPNLDDGELYLPSDIFPEEIIYTHHNPTNTILKRTITTPKFPCELTYMEDLAHQLATYALLEPNLSKQAPKHPPNATQFVPVHSLRSGLGLWGSPAAVGNSAVGLRSDGFRPSSRPGYQFYETEPNRAKVERVMQVNARTLQRQRQVPAQNRFFPFRPSNGSGFVKKSGGTGVFLPRAFLIPEMRKKPIMESAQQTPPERNVGEQRMAFQYPSSDVGLPRDWSY